MQVGVFTVRSFLAGAFLSTEVSWITGILAGCVERLEKEFRNSPSR